VYTTVIELIQNHTAVRYTSWLRRNVHKFILHRTLVFTFSGQVQCAWLLSVNGVSRWQEGLVFQKKRKV